MRHRRCAYGDLSLVDDVVDIEGRDWVEDQEPPNADVDFPERFDHLYHLPAVSHLQPGEEDRPYYEAWTITVTPPRTESFECRKPWRRRSVGSRTHSKGVQLKMEPATQSQLAEMHLEAVEAYKRKHSRSRPARAVCGPGRTYEEDLDERCRALPRSVKTVVSNLLAQRGKSTSNRWRIRTWTVVSMREHLQDRFAHTEFTEVKRHKLRFWKNPKPDEPLLYTFIIRGAVTRVAETEDGFNCFAATANPWSRADEADALRRYREESRRQEEERERQEEERIKRQLSSRSPSPSTRSQPRSPSLSSISTAWRCRRSRSSSPPPYRCSGRRPYRSFSYGSTRSDSPPPYRRSRSISPGYRQYRFTPRYPASIDGGPSGPRWNCPPGVVVDNFRGRAHFVDTPWSRPPPPPPPPMPPMPRGRIRPLYEPDFGGPSNDPLLRPPTPPFPAPFPADRVPYPSTFRPSIRSYPQPQYQVPRNFPGPRYDLYDYDVDPTAISPPPPPPRPTSSSEWTHPNSPRLPRQQGSIPPPPLNDTSLAEIPHSLRPLGPYDPSPSSPSPGQQQIQHQASALPRPVSPVPGPKLPSPNPSQQSGGSNRSSIPPLPPAPNPYSCLTTPSITSYGAGTENEGGSEGVRSPVMSVAGVEGGEAGERSSGQCRLRWSDVPDNNWEQADDW
ncbi:hypothetical protein VTJ04DRAFT_2706 [Mycothermus thermophilus]|uniref:uncharacterized protein n=1 Tax=Humicola insolens TaxID=85995 RepID=UPI003742C15C